MMNNNGPVMVYIELSGSGEILPVSLETLKIGRSIADKSGETLVALIIGKDIGKAVDDLRHYPVDVVYSVENSVFERYHPELYLAVFKKAYDVSQPKVLLFGNTLTSIDIGPRVAFELKTGLISDCVKVAVDEKELLFTKSVYSGNVIAEFTSTTEPYIATIRSRASEPIERIDSVCDEITPIDVEINPSMLKIEVVEQVCEEENGNKLSTASIVVAGGRGMGSEEGFSKLAKLAEILHAGIGSSRPPCDLSWVPAKTQVGLTGEIVAPSLYIAVGISGSFQHLAGMSDSKVIVAINKDPKANIFKYADYGIVGEHEDILPALEETLRELLN